LIFLKSPKTRESEEYESGEKLASRTASESGTVGYMRRILVQGFDRIEDLLYVGLGLLLACSALALLMTSAIGLWQNILGGVAITGIISLLDRLLLILMIVELLYTVQVSFRQHSLTPDPFIIVGLIAVTRRILIVTAEFATIFEKGDQVRFYNAMIELGLLTIMVVALVASLRILRKRET
jgi:uncharacterized membrane protein (DUF373 family)